MNRKEEILAEAHNVAKKAYISVGTLPKSSLVTVGCDMAEWADQTMINKACKWLDENCRRYILTAKDISDFKKAMEE